MQRYSFQLNLKNYIFITCISKKFTLQNTFISVKNNKNSICLKK
jgi:hypothetical protein